jgi:hypothetical protein
MKGGPKVTEQTMPTRNGFPGEKNPATISYDNNTNADYKSGFASEGTRGEHAKVDETLQGGKHIKQTVFTPKIDDGKK